MIDKLQVAIGILIGLKKSMLYAIDTQKTEKRFISHKLAFLEAYKIPIPLFKMQIRRKCQIWPRIQLTSEAF